MKKNKFITGFFAILLTTLMSCGSLDLEPLDYYGSENFWKSEAQIDGFVLGLHKQIRDSQSTFWVLGEARGGLQKHGTSSLSTSLDYSSPIKDQNLTKDNAGMSGWSGFYQKLLNVNLGIDKLENEVTFLDEDAKQYYLGQLYGIRAFTYFYLYRTYGGVPLISDSKVLKGENSAEPLYTARSTPKEILDFIKEDIGRSEAGFGTDMTIGHDKASWSKYATLMLKAEVYLWSAKVTTGDQAPVSGDLAMAESALNSVKDNFVLLSDFKDVFSYDNKGNDEIIFTIRYIETEATNFASNFCYQQNLIGSKWFTNNTQNADSLDTKGSGILRNEYIFPFFRSIDDLDTRKTATFLDIYDKDEVTGEFINGGLVMRKFLGVVNSDGNRKFADDAPIYRYADVLLMLAEVENKKGGDPAQYINMIRERAYAGNYDAAIHAYVNSDFETNELAILAERDKEFVWEGKRWFDVCRMQDGSGNPLAFSDKVTYGNGPVIPSSESHKLLWPVDVNTLNVDPLLKQTPGY